MIAVDLHEVGDAILALAVMRRRVERRPDAAVRIHPRRAVAAHLEREHAGHVGGKRQHLQVEHQLDVLVERVGDANRRLGQLAGFARRVLRFNALNAAFDFAHLFEERAKARAVAGAEVLL